MKNRNLFASAALLAAFALAAPARAELVTNGGFEAGSLSGWSGTVLSNPYSGAYCPGSGSAPEGSCEAFLGTNGASDTLSQLLTTVAGQTYAISFVLQGDGSTPSHFSLSFGGQTLYDASDDASTATQTLSFLATASDATSLLNFEFQNDPGYFILDAVSVVAAVPEPASIALTLGALAGLALVQRRRASGKT